MNTASASLAMGLCLVLGSHAVAQDESTSDDDEARTTFLHGRAMVEEGRFIEAKEALTRSLALSPRLPTAFNLAIALAGGGEAIEAVALLDRVLSAEFGPISDEVRATAEERRTVFARTVAHLRLTTEPTRAALRLDGEETPRAPMLHLNPGAHVLDVSAEDYLNRQERLQMQPGETRDLAIALELAPPPEVEVRERSIARSPWFWILTGVVVAGAATALALVLRPDPNRPDDIDLRVETLRSPW